MWLRLPLISEVQITILGTHKAPTTVTSLHSAAIIPNLSRPPDPRFEPQAGNDPCRSYWNQGLKNNVAQSPMSEDELTVATCNTVRIGLRFNFSNF